MSSGTALQARPTAVSARLERVLLRMRYLGAAIVALMTIAFPPEGLVVAALVPVLLIGASALAQRRLAAHGLAGLPRRDQWALLAVDVVAAAVTYAVFLGQPRALAVALVAILLFMLAVRFGAGGAGAGAVLLAMGLVGRVAAQRSGMTNGAVRLELLLLWAAVAVLLAALALELRAQERRFHAALAAREQLAADLRDTVAQTMGFAGIDPRTATHDEVLGAVRALVEQEAPEREALIARVATILAIPHHGLSGREQEILLLLARDASDARIARELFISPSTVRNHLFNMRHKLGLSSRAELLAFAREHAPPPADG